MISDHVTPLTVEVCLLLDNYFEIFSMEASLPCDVVDKTLYPVSMDSM